MRKILTSHEVRFIDEGTSKILDSTNRGNVIELDYEFIIEKTATSIDDNDENENELYADCKNDIFDNEQVFNGFEVMQ